MKQIVLLHILVLICTVHVQCKKGFGPGDQDYGYVKVRRGAHVFWWLYHTTANVKKSTERPIILWLQGGPGASSTGYGNFEILGPLDVNLKPRSYTWVKNFNVLFVDNPVGTGFSYVDNLSYLTTNNKQIAKDLVELLKGFYKSLPKFRNTPLYVYGQSYGGKMGVEFVQLLSKEVSLGNIKSNISGIAMGDAWIHPIDSTLSWAKYLYHFSLVDRIGAETIYKQALVTKKAFDEKRYLESTNEWSKTQSVVFQQTDGIDFYNVANKPKRKSDDVDELFASNLNKSATKASSLKQLMNGPVKKALGIPLHVIWGIQSNFVFNYLKTDFMKPVTSIVERLLNETQIKVHVYNGNLDLIVDTPGQMAWVNRLRWKDYDKYKNAERNTIWVDNQMEGYQKIGGKFTFFWINSAGHSVPSDNPTGARVLLKSMTGV